ncbi:MAG: hypothetical protein KAW12_20125 [Candidatus Aminicenantes bacterium]|nr:hypothetical protein [Candidatus Aminicenantes bacterium]
MSPSEARIMIDCLSPGLYQVDQAGLPGNYRDASLRPLPVSTSAGGDGK